MEQRIHFVMLATLSLSFLSLPAQADPLSGVEETLTNLDGCEGFSRFETLPYIGEYEYDIRHEPGCDVVETWFLVDPTPNSSGYYNYWHQQTSTPSINCDPSC